MQRKPVHQLLEENARQIVERFVAEVREHALPPRTLTHEEVADHLHRYVVEMVAVLKAGLADQIQSSKAARQHGEQRWYVGYDLKSVILEYGVFRRVVLDIIQSSGGSLTMADWDPLSRFLDVAVADAAVEFTENSVSQINEALRQAQQSAEARDEILAIVSHDLKNPLNVIQGSVALVARELASTDLEGSRLQLSKNVGRIQRASVTMDNLISELVDLGRIRAGQLQLDKKEHRAEELLRDAYEQAVPLAEQRSVRLTMDVERGGVMSCDRERVLQILANLVGNAIKFTGEGGLVTMRVSCSTDACTFEVRDTGPGISQEALPHIFNKFWQVAETAAQGTGLGLSIAKGFVELHGGSIWCESTLGQGSHFFFKLPQRPGPAT